MATPQNSSVIKAFKMLEVFKEHDRPLALRTIANDAKTSLAATHRLILTLKSLGFVRGDIHGHYLLGPKLIELGDIARRSAAPLGTLAYLVQRVSEMSNETAHIAMLRGDMVRYVAKAETARGLRTVTQVGKELEAYCTGVGKVLIAYAPSRMRNRYLQSGEFIRLTPNTICDRTRLASEFRKIRKAGFAVDAEEFEEGLKCVAVPIFEGNGKVVASLSISGPSSRIDRAQLHELVSQLQQFSRVITSRVRASDWAYM